MISKDEPPVGRPSIPEGITALRRDGHSENITISLEAENARLRARIAELEEDIQTVFINVAETFEAVATTLNDQAILRGKDMAEFMEPARQAAVEGDSVRLLAFTRQGIAKMKKALKDSSSAPLLTSKPEPPHLVAVSKIELRAIEIKEKIESSDAKVFSSRDARLYLSGIEGEEPSRRDTIRALKKTVKMLPQFALEVVGGVSRLICRGDDDSRPPDKVEKKPERCLWQRHGLSIALPWLNSQGLRDSSGGT
jgi:hypothetical protein